MILDRVAGNVSVQTEPFYNFCDEHGIMIWQDAMFGGSHYPRNSEFLANIEEEITQQVSFGTPYDPLFSSGTCLKCRSCRLLDGQCREQLVFS